MTCVRVGGGGRVLVGGLRGLLATGLGGLRASHISSTRVRCRVLVSLLSCMRCCSGVLVVLLGRVRG
jgi:hypothetical protein